MAFNNFNQNNQPFAPMPQNFNQSPQQNIQPLFPQPQGNVYTINSTLEVANVPVGAGISIALCLNEGFMYIKTIQNGNPLFWAYKITPYDNAKQPENQQEQKAEENPVAVQLEQYNNRFLNLEKQVDDIKKTIKKSSKGGEWDL